MSVSDQLPTVLFLRSSPSPLSTVLSTRFNLITSFSFPNDTLPLPAFLSNHSDSARAIIVSTTISVNSELLSLLPRLGIVVTPSAGIDHIDLDECKRRGIKVVNAPDVYSEDVADCAVGLVIDVLRKISQGNRFVRKGSWAAGLQEFPLGSKLGEKRVGIVGLGKIGIRIANRLKAFNCIISYTSRTIKLSSSYTHIPQIHDLVSSNDIIILCCPLNEETYHIIDKEALNLLGKDGVIINVGRGALIDEDELVKSLIKGDIKGAGLDVFENEPNVPEELFDLDNVVLMPHRAAFTKEAVFEHIAELIISNLDAFFTGNPLVTPVLEK